MGYRDKMGHRLAHLDHAHKRALHLRDSHGSEPVMHVPADNDNKMNFIHNAGGLRQNAAGKDVEVQTVESVLYVTMPQSFAGDAQLSTATGDSAPASQDAAAAYESAKAAAGQAHVASSAPAVTPAEASSTPTLYTAPQQRTRSAETSLQTGPMQVCLATHVAVKFENENNLLTCNSTEHSSEQQRRTPSDWPNRKHSHVCYFRPDRGRSCGWRYSSLRHQQQRRRNRN